LFLDHSPLARLFTFLNLPTQRQMAAFARSVRLASSLCAAPRPIMARSVAVATNRHAAFSLSARRLKSEIIKETEVPVTVYNPDAKGVASATSDHFSIPVKPTPTTHEPVADETGQLTPLDEKVYKQMPHTLQKMSVMGKVIIVTG